MGATNKEVDLGVKKQKGVSRRDFLRTATLSALGTIVAGNSSQTNELPKITEKESAPAPEKEVVRENKKTVEGEIEKCKQIIENEQYEEIIKNPYLVSALYYSEQAVRKMAPPHKYSTEKIIWNIYPLITRQFRENYITTLKRTIAGESAKNLINLGTQCQPLDTIDFGKNLEENHGDAIDLFIKEGSDVHAMLGGIVVLAENNWKENDDLSTSSYRGGNTVIVFNPQDDSFYRYAHMQEIIATAGKFIPSGALIGIVGHTGINASMAGYGEHLHFEIQRYDRAKGVMIAHNVFDLKRKLETAKS